MLATFDYFKKFETPTLSLCNPNNEVKGSLDGYIKNFKLSPVFNAVWEISIDIYKTKGRSKIKKELPCFDLIKTRRKILIENIGYFIITKVEINDGKYNNKYVSVSATSCEISIANKKLNYFDGTYKFYDELEGNTTNPTTLMGKIMKFLPVWTLGHVDSSIANKYRTFDKPDDTVYGFLLSDVQKAYDCIFEFDMLNFVINVYDKLNYINKTTIFLTKEETIDDIKIVDDGTKIKTALNVFGQNDLDIRYVNPLGLNTIYNFDGCIDMMSADLISAINTWKTKVEASQTTFESTLLSLKNENATLEVLNQELMTLQTNLAGYYTQKTAIDLANGDLTTINGYISSTQSAIIAKQNQIDTQQLIVDDLVTTRDNIFDENSFGNNFTEVQYNELADGFIFEDTYNDEYISKTDNMTYEQFQTQSLELYNKAKQVLSEISQANYEYEISTNNFIFDKRFLPYTEQLKVGCLINIEVEEDNVIELILLKMDIDYEEKTINFTFGTKYKLEDPLSLFNDRYADLTTSANTLNYERGIYGKYIKSGQATTLNNFVNSPINVNANPIVNSQGQTVIDDSGNYNGQIIVDGEVSPKQLKLVGNSLILTDDNFETLSTKIIGDVTLSGSKVYGVNAEAIKTGKIVGTSNPNVFFDLDNSNISADNLTSSDGSGYSAKIGSIPIHTIEGDTYYAQGLGFADEKGYVYGYIAKTNANGFSLVEPGSVNWGLFQSDGNGLAIQKIFGNENFGILYIKETSLSLEKVFSSTNFGQIRFDTTSMDLHSGVNNVLSLDNDNFVVHCSNMPSDKNLLYIDKTQFITDVQSAFFKDLYSNFSLVTSDREKKTDIKQENIYALDRLKDIKAYSYKLGDTKQKLGLMYDEAPPEIQSESKKGDKHIDLYAFNSLNAKGIQELNKKLDRLTNYVDDLVLENQQLRKDLERQKKVNDIRIGNVKTEIEVIKNSEK